MKLKSQNERILDHYELVYGKGKKTFGEMLVLGFKVGAIVAIVLAVGSCMGLV